MKKKACALFLMVSLLTINVVPVMAETDKEILFRDIPWGMSYTDVDALHPEFELWNISGDSYVSPSVDAVLLDDNYEGIDFEYGDINILANAFNEEIDVAGYTTKEMELYFAYTINDGTLNKTEQDSALYGATYRFEALDLESMSTDLLAKLTSLYGEPEKDTIDSDFMGNKYTFTYWYGANDTELVLKTRKTKEDRELYSDTISISYAWRKGDELLQAASDALKADAQSAEAGVYGNGDTNGL